MGNPNPRREAWRDLCADFQLPDDKAGLHRRRARRDRTTAHWRDHRLCGQARRAIQMGLADCADPALQSLIVLDVQPTGNAACLRVHLLAPIDSDLTHTAARLGAAASHLRREVAQSIRRNKTPQLAFELHTQDPTP